MDAASAAVSYFVGIWFCPESGEFCRNKTRQNFFHTVDSATRAGERLRVALETGSSSQRVSVSDNLYRAGLTERQDLYENEL